MAFRAQTSTFVADSVGQAHDGVAGGTCSAFHGHRICPGLTVHPIAYLVAGNRRAAIIGRHTPHYRDGLAFDARRQSCRRARCPARRGGGLGSLALVDAVHCPHLESIQRAIGQTADGDASRASATGDRHPLTPGLAGRGVAVLVTQNLRTAVSRRTPAQSNLLVTRRGRQIRRRTRSGFSQRSAGRGALTTADAVHGPHLKGVGDSVLQAGHRVAGGACAAGNVRPFNETATALLDAVLVTGDRRSTVTRRCAPTQSDLLVSGGRRQSSGRTRSALHRDHDGH